MFITRQWPPISRMVLTLWALAVAVIIYGSLLPAATLHRWHYDDMAPNDKLVHFLGYSILAILPVAFLDVVGIGIALAASMIPLGVGLEFAQRLVPGRSFELADMIADSLGVIAGIILAFSLRRMLRLPVRAVAPGK